MLHRNEIEVVYHSLMILELASAIVSRAVLEAERMGIAVTTAIVDSGGHLVTLSRMDDAPFLTVEIAIGKAYTAVAFKSSSADLAKRLEGRDQLTTSVVVATNGRFLLGAGGIPILVAERVIGAVGVSGGTSEEDVAIAQVALENG